MVVEFADMFIFGGAYSVDLVTSALGYLCGAATKFSLSIASLQMLEASSQVRLNVGCSTDVTHQPRKLHGLCYADPSYK